MPSSDGTNETSAISVQFVFRFRFEDKICIGSFEVIMPIVIIIHTKSKMMHAVITSYNKISMHTLAAYRLY